MGADPTMEELIKMGAKAAYERATDLPWEEAAYQYKTAFLEDARAILTAVLPRVLEGARTALTSVAIPAEIFGPDWSDGDELAVEPIDGDEREGNGNLLFTVKVGDLRRARSAYARIDALLKGE